MTDNLLALKENVILALRLCEDPEVREELGSRIEQFINDLSGLQSLDIRGFQAMDIDKIRYFNGPNPYDDTYEKAKPLLNLTATILNQISGIRARYEQ